MQAIRQTIELNQLKGIIEIPEDFQYTKVEVLVLPVEVEENQILTSAFNPEEFFGVSHLPNVDKKIQDLRNEWEKP